MNDINFVEINPEKLLDEMVNSFESFLGETLYPGDERRIILQQLLPVLIGIKSEINDSARMNLLRYARGEFLDVIGERTDTPRLPANKASVTLRFILSAAQPEVVSIPAGTRATPDGKIYFTTVQNLNIPAGSLSGDIKAESSTEGTACNGFSAGQINKLVDPVPFISSVLNLDTSSGGADIEPDDDGVNVWSGYRERIRQSPSKMTTAGPEDAYIYWAKTANAYIQDIAVTSPSDGQIKITVLMKNGEIPTQQILDSVKDACNDRKRRPLTDHVTVDAPGTVVYNINATYYISKDNEVNEIAIKSSINDIVEQYTLWQKSKMGRAINPDYFRQLMLNAGVYRIDITEPAFTQINADSIAIIETIIVNYGGLI